MLDLLSTRKEFRLNLGRGGFSAPLAPPTSLGLTNTALADFDGDGDVDLPTSGLLPQLFRTEGASPPTFTLAKSLPRFRGPAMGWWVDVDGDGDNDMLFSPLRSPGGTVERWSNEGEAGFTRIGPGLTQPLLAPPADYDGDGDPDLVSVSQGLDPSGGVALYDNDGVGRFSERRVLLRRRTTQSWPSIRSAR